MGSKNKIATGILWSYLQAWIARGFTTFGFLVVGLFLGPEEFGLFALVVAFLMFAEMLCEQSLSQTLVQLPEINNSQLSSLFLIGGGGGVALSFILFFCAQFIADFFASSALVAYLRIAAICPLLIGLSVVPMGLLRRNLDFKSLAKRTVAASGISSFLGIALVIAGYGILGLLAQSVCFYAISVFMLWRCCEWRPMTLSMAPDTRAILRLASANASTKLLDFAETRGVEMMVGAMAGLPALGVFAFANKIAQTGFQTVVAPVLEVIFAGVAREGRSGKLADTLRSGQLIISTLPALALFGLACSAAPLLGGLYGERWQEAILPLSLVATAYLLRSFLYVYGTALLALRLSAASIAVAAIRTGTSVTTVYFLLYQGLGATGAAWGYLLGGMIVAPASAFLLSKETQISMKTLLVIPLKVVLAAAVGLMVYLAGNQLVLAPGDTSLMAWLVASIAGLVFFLIVVGLNAGMFVRVLRQSGQTGLVGRLQYPVLLLAKTILDWRELLRLQWFAFSLRLSMMIHRRHPVGLGCYLVVPADTTELDGSLGDQALLLGLGGLVDRISTKIVVSEHFNPGSIFADSAFVRAWYGLAAGWRLGLESATANGLYVIGADVMDGYYTPGVSRQRLLLINAFAKAGITCCITGFSFNEAPSPSVVEEFRRLPSGVRVCLRDAVSLERFERIVGRPAILVADLAFLVTEAVQAPVADCVLPWAARQKAAGRLVLGININPQVVAHLKQGTEEAISDSVAECCKGLLQENISIVLIPHDFRPGCADLRVMNMVWSRISGVSGDCGMVLAEQFSAQEIKTACRALDLVLSARMHLAIGALSVCTPVCGIQYQGKFEGLFKHFGFARDIFIEPENALDPIKLKKFLNHNINRVGMLRAQVIDYLPAVKELAKLNQAVVVVS